MQKHHHLNINSSEIGKYVILHSSPAMIPVIANHFDTAMEISSNEEYLAYSGQIDGIKVSAISTGNGGPSIAICLEELIAAGAHTFIKIGSACPFKNLQRTDHYIITEGAIRDEGFSRCYAPIKFPAIPDQDVSFALKEACRELDLKFKSGIVYCNDFDFCEDRIPDLILKRLNQKNRVWNHLNLIAKTMESATLFVVGKVRNVRTGELLMFEDVDDFTDSGEEISIDNIIKIAVHSIKILENLERVKP